MPVMAGVDGSGAPVGNPLIVGVPGPATSRTAERLALVRDELIAWFKTLASAAVYATLIVTFGFQVARVEGMSMAPTLEDQDRLIVNKLAYRIGEPHHGDIVMLYYPIDPNKSFVKRVIASVSWTAMYSSTRRRWTIRTCSRSSATTTTGARRSSRKATTS
jgi:hypothetical protein